MLFSTLRNNLFLSLSDLLQLFILIPTLKVLRERQIILILDIDLLACGEINRISLEEHLFKLLVFALEVHEVHLGTLVLVAEDTEFFHVVFLEKELFGQKEGLRLEIIGRRVVVFFGHFLVFLVKILSHHGPSTTISLLVAIDFHDLGIV